MKPWLDADGNEVLDDHLIKILKPYSTQGGTIYVGADSMLYSKSCSFACAIALHDKHQQIAKYFYRRHVDKSNHFKDIRLKILSEVSLAIEVAQDIMKYVPEANIEIHVDIGAGRKSKTRSMIDQVTGWILGSGFKCKIKPRSWASSSIADWHTK